MWSLKTIDFPVALTAKGLERVKHVAQGNAGILALQLVGVDAVACGCLALQGTVDAADILKQFHLQLYHLVSAHVGAVGTDLFGFVVVELRVVGQQAVDNNSNYIPL